MFGLSENQQGLCELNPRCMKKPRRANVCVKNSSHQESSLHWSSRDLCEVMAGELVYNRMTGSDLHLPSLWTLQKADVGLCGCISMHLLLCLYVPVAKQDVIDQHGAEVERYNLLQSSLPVVYLRCCESSFCPSICLSLSSIFPDGIRGPAEAFRHPPSEASPCEPRPRGPGQIFQWSRGVVGDDAPCGGLQACGQGHRHSSSQSPQVRKPQHTTVDGYFRVQQKAIYGRQVLLSSAHADIMPLSPSTRDQGCGTKATATFQSVVISKSFMAINTFEVVMFCFTEALRITFLSVQL